MQGSSTPNKCHTAFLHCTAELSIPLHPSTSNRIAAFPVFITVGKIRIRVVDTGALKFRSADMAVAVDSPVAKACKIEFICKSSFIVMSGRLIRQ